MTTGVVRPWCLRERTCLGGSIQTQGIPDMTTASATAQTNQTPQQTFDSLVEQIRQLAYKYIEDKDFVSAQLAFKKLLELTPQDINALRLCAADR
jgi:Tfp pilus assembly protein PilF